MSSCRKPIFAVLALVAGLSIVGLSGCTGNSIDDADAPHVVLEVVTFDSPAVSAEQDTAGGGGCQITVNEWTVSMRAEPINSLAGSPFNDVVMDSVEMVYVWDDPALVTPNRSAGLGAVAIPVSATGQITFAPIGFTDLTAAFLGESATVQLTFRGRTVEGTGVFFVTSKQLLVETCS